MADHNNTRGVVSGTPDQAGSTPAPFISATHVYRFARVNEDTNAFRARCLKCDESIPVGTKWADLNGEAFRAYYCDPCKRAIEASK